MLTSKKCIYCDEASDFTDEHMFPAGLGGDDRKYLLKDLVCGHCNTVVFSKLETQLMRNSAFAVGRIFMQPTGRGKGSKANKTVLNADCVSIVEPLSSIALEGEIRAGGEAYILPQIIFSRNEVSATGSQFAEMKEFFSKLKEMLGDNVKLIRKFKDAGVARYEVDLLELKDSKSYELVEKIQMAKPPVGIWLEHLVPPATALAGTRFVTRLFLRPAGQLVLRVISDRHAYIALSEARMYLREVSSIEIPASTSIEKPNVHVGMNMLSELINRAIAKIGVNIACFEYGPEFVCFDGFSSIKSSIISGVNPIPVVSLPDPRLQDLFDLDKREIHLAAIFPFAMEEGKASLSFVLRLYGGGIQVILLAKNVQMPKIEEPVVFIVKYLEHKIERQLISDYLAELTIGS